MSESAYAMHDSVKIKIVNVCVIKSFVENLQKTRMRSLIRQPLFGIKDETFRFLNLMKKYRAALTRRKPACLLPRTKSAEAASPFIILARIMIYKGDFRIFSKIFMNLTLYLDACYSEV